MPRMPFDGTYQVTCDHDCHKRREPPSAGGEDFPLPLGTPLKAPFDGEAIFHDSGTGGWTMTIAATGEELYGLTVQLMHLSDSTVLELGDSGPIVEDQTIALSGGEPGHPGAGNSRGPHLHGHGILDGRRIPLTTAIEWARKRMPARQPEEDPVKDSLLIWTRHKTTKGMLWAHISPELARFVPIFKQDTANALAKRIGAPAVEVAGGEWNGYRIAAGLQPDPNV